MRQPIVAGNWKMFGSGDRVARFCRALNEARCPGDVDVLLFPPVGYLSTFVAGLESTWVQLGAQDLHDALGGRPHRRDIRRDDQGSWRAAGYWSGHSERRLHQAETNELVAAKFATALSAGLTPIVCVGETLQEREAGTADEVVHRQLQTVLDVVGTTGLTRGAIAYEPVWAIGTGHAATAEQAENMHGFIRADIGRRNEAAGRSVRILYGGSVKPENAAELFGQPNIDGGLVGGASLAPDSFLKIVAAGSGG